MDIQKNLQMALLKSLIIPVLLLAFFIAAPFWLNGKIRGEVVKLDFREAFRVIAAGFGRAPTA